MRGRQLMADNSRIQQMMLEQRQRREEVERGTEKSQARKIMSFCFSRAAFMKKEPFCQSVKQQRGFFSAAWSLLSIHRLLGEPGWPSGG